MDKLDYWQPIPLGTKRWKASYNRRLQVENVNSMVQEKGGLDAELCRVRGLGPHTLAALAVSIAHNLKQAKKDPYADDANDDTGEDDSTGNPIQGDPGEPDDNLPEGGAGADLPRSPDNGNNSGNALRAPP